MDASFQSRSLPILSKNVAIECISVWNIETSERVMRVFLFRARTWGEGSQRGRGPTPGARFLNLPANSTRLLANISCLVYTNNVRPGYKLRKGNTNASSRRRPKVESNISILIHIAAAHYLARYETSELWAAV